MAETDAHTKATRWKKRPSPSGYRRLWRHLKRSRARAGLIVALICVLLYALISHVVSNTELADACKQFVLVLAGAAAGAAFLPELSSDIWRFTGDHVRELVPTHQRDRLSQTLIGAESNDDEWSSLVYREALVPLLAAANDPSQVVKEMNYDVKAQLNKVSTNAGVSLNYHRIDVSSTSKRILPVVDDETYWISVVRTKDLLDAEFEQKACLARELAVLTDNSGGALVGEAWRTFVTEQCIVQVTINGQTQNPVIALDDNGSDVIRWKWKLNPPAAEVNRRVGVNIEFVFPIGAHEDRFPVYFSGYYCAGETTVAMEVEDSVSTTELRCDVFFGRGLDSHKAYDVGRVDMPHCKRRKFSTDSDSILWPGSGVLFDWHSCEPKCP